MLILRNHLELGSSQDSNQFGCMCKFEENRLSGFKIPSLEINRQLKIF